MIDVWFGTAMWWWFAGQCIMRDMSLIDIGCSVSVMMVTGCSKRVLALRQWLDNSVNLIIASWSRYYTHWVWCNNLHTRLRLFLAEKRLKLWKNRFQKYVWFNAIIEKSFKSSEENIVITIVSNMSVIYVHTDSPRIAAMFSWYYSVRAYYN